MNTKNKKSGVPDLSWMWHCSNDPKNILDFKWLTGNSERVDSLNIAASMGFRIALRKLETMELIKMQDLDRSPRQADQEKWDAIFKNLTENL